MKFHSFLKSIITSLTFLIGILLVSCNSKVFVPQPDKKTDVDDPGAEIMQTYLIRWLDKSDNVIHKISAAEGSDLEADMEVATELIKSINVDTNDSSFEFYRWDDDSNIIADKSKDYRPIYTAREKDIFTYSNFRSEKNPFTNMDENVCTVAKYNRTNLASVTIPAYIVYSKTVYNVVAIADGAFKNSPALQTVYIGSNIRTIGNNAFDGCRNLQNVFTVNKPNQYTDRAYSYLQEIGDEAFANCSNLEYVVDNEYQRSIQYPGTISLTHNVKSIGDRVFSNCSKIERASFGEVIESIGQGVFENCTELVTLSVAYNNPYYFSVIVDNGGNRFDLNMVIKRQTNTTNAYVSIGCKRSKFYNIYEVMSLHDAVANINTSDARAYEEVDINVEIPYEVEIPEKAFYNIIFDEVSKAQGTKDQIIPIEELHIPRCYVSVGDYAFCNDKTSSPVKVVTFDGYLKTVSSSSFEGCDDLTTINLERKIVEPKYTTFVRRNNQIKDISNEETFFRSYKGGIVEMKRDKNNQLNDAILTVGVIGSSEISDADSIKIFKIADRAFYRRNIATFSISSSYLESIGVYAFARCTKLKVITSFDPKHKALTMIPDHCFYGCSSLEKVDVPEQIQKLDAYAFASCSKLKEIILGNSIYEILSYAFQGCASLNKVYYTGTAARWSSIRYKHLVEWQYLGLDYLFNAHCTAGYAR